MANYSYIGYEPTAIIFGGGTITLSGTYDPSTDRRVFDVTDGAGGTVLGGRADNGVIFDGDRFDNEDGDDATQTGVATSLDGSTTFATGNIYLEESYSLSKPGGGTIDVYRVEVDGTLVGYITSEPLVAGVSYSFTTSNVTPPNAPNTTDPTALIDVPCFTSGTLIRTPKGNRPIEELEIGDTVIVASGKIRQIRWIGSRKLNKTNLDANPKLQPVRITKGAMGNGLPQRDLLVSRQHRMLVSSKVAERMFGVTDALIAANKLTTHPNVGVDESVEEVEYFHLLFDKHEVIFAEGAPSESLYTGPEALKALSPEAREEIFALFPEITRPEHHPEPASLIPCGKQQKHLVNRHIKNRKPFCHAGAIL